MHEFFFLVIFPCANIFFVLRPTHPVSFLMVRPLFIDFQKAFDCVSHSILLHKLEHNFGITGNLLAWLRGYLSEREPYIVINGIPS